MLSSHVPTSLLIFTLTFTFTVTFTFTWASSPATIQKPTKTQTTAPPPPPPLIYDFIIIGGGPAGSILATRLAQAKHHVLLMEAGGYTQSSLRTTEEIQRRRQQHSKPVECYGSLSCQDSKKQHPPTVTPPSVIPSNVLANLTMFDIPLEWNQITLVSSNVNDDTYNAKSNNENSNVNNAFLIEMNEFEWEIWDHPRPRLAKGLGGCGIHNAMIYVRGIPMDFTSWPTGWNTWEMDILPHYMRSEHQMDSNMHDTWHSMDGEIPITSPNGMDSLSQSFMQACLEAGVPQVTDLNAPTRNIGVGTYQFMISNGVRITAATAMYGDGSKGQHDSHLTIIHYAQATRIITENHNGTIRAVGIEYSQGTTSRYPSWDGHIQRVMARHEIILSAGAINTPKLLMLSGIGDAQHLASLPYAIPLTRDIPLVGRNLMDGARVIMQWSIRRPVNTSTSTSTSCDNDTSGACLYPLCLPSDPESKNNPECVKRHEEYLKEVASAFNSHHTTHHTTPTSILGTPGFSLGVFLKSPFSKDKADVQLTIYSWDKEHRNWPEQHYGVMTIEIILNTPLSRGRVMLRSSDPFLPPHITSTYYTHPQDMEVLLWALKEVRRITQQAPLRNLLETELVPGDGLDDDLLRDYIRCDSAHFRVTSCDSDQRVTGHLAGTARLSSSPDEGVVDPMLRVWGVEKLRVADASVLPSLPSGNTHATVMMVGDKAAAMLLDEYGQGKHPQHQHVMMTQAHAAAGAAAAASHTHDIPSQEDGDDTDGTGRTELSLPLLLFLILAIVTIVSIVSILAHCWYATRTKSLFPPLLATTSRRPSERRLVP